MAEVKLERPSEPAAAVALLDVEPELGAGIPDEELALARRYTVVRRLDLPAGRWRPPAEEALENHPFGLLIVEGLVTRSIALADRSSAQLLGPGELISPWSEPDGLVPAVVEWRVNTPARLAVLDDRVLVAARRWPAIFRTLQHRAACQTNRLAIHHAIAQLPRVDTRILAVLWHLAERFGRVTPSGVVVPLRLTHEALGHLIGAQRPTVTLALRELGERGAVQRGDDGSWLLAEGTQVALAPEAGAGIPLPTIVPTPDAAPPPARPPAQAAPGGPPPPDGSDLGRLRERLGELRAALPEQRRDVDRLLSDARTAKEHSASLRERVDAERAGRTDRLRG